MLSAGLIFRTVSDRVASWMSLTMFSCHKSSNCARGLVLTALVIVGCSGEKVSTSVLTGVVKYKGEPVPEASVSLVPLSPDGRPATAVTDAEGKFSVKTFLTNSQVEGAIPGDYGVGVMKMSAGGAPPMGTTQAELQEFAKQGGVPKSLLPKVYQDPKKSKLSVTVKADANPPLVLELKD
ncbi:hypothetical protein AYO47_04650 [Planctomyces sp. SCGC AG-212-M04]|nr:hypothetical protein AYO47_04650 [Planctomyces sp. SCGC AG-212-M04]